VYFIFSEKEKEKELWQLGMDENLCGNCVGRIDLKNSV
jgi:hypothetical protein